ncbi:MBL fold metallo-hydrolase [Actinoallomurus sp. NPDC052274]|uniref:MBL fold metallo-hydrolase n=1 Tax=Actinoallomurus sp. NPDC052274 TaxID=3155420 RepID=UPI00341E671F
MTSAPLDHGPEGYDIDWGIVMTEEDLIPKSDGLFFIGNATTVIRYGGFTLLTDPNFIRRGQKVHLGWGVMTTRLLDPAVPVDRLPPLDGIVLSHLHGDHWDRVARRNLDKDLPIVTTTHAARRLKPQGFGNSHGLRTWEDHEFVSGDRVLRVISAPGRHAPGAFQMMLPPVMGSILEFGSRGGRVDLRMYISGDTLMYDDLAEIPRRYPDIDVGVVHLGGTKILNALLVTMDGRQGADWVELVNASRVLPIHHNDYTVMKSPLSDFDAEVRRRGLQDKVQVVQRGTLIEL